MFMRVSARLHAQRRAGRAGADDQHVDRLFRHVPAILLVDWLARIAGGESNG